MKKILFLLCLASFSLYAMPLSNTNNLTKQLTKIYSDEIIDTKKQNLVSKEKIIDDYKVDFLVTKRNKLILNGIVIENTKKQQ